MAINLSQKSLNYELHFNYGSRTVICSFGGMVLIGVLESLDSLNATCECLQTTLENCRICIERFLNCRIDISRLGFAGFARA